MAHTDMRAAQGYILTNMTHEIVVFETILHAVATVPRGGLIGHWGGWGFLVRYKSLFCRNIAILHSFCHPLAA